MLRVRAGLRCAAMAALTREERRVMSVVERCKNLVCLADLMTHNHMTMREAFKCLASIETKGMLERVRDNAGVFYWQTK